MSADAGATLKLRSAGVVERRERVLLHRGREDDFWTLPGGTIEPGERSDAALCREIDEEMHIAARAVQLLWLLDVPEQAWQSWPEHEGEFEMAETYIIFRWAALSDLSATSIKPVFLRRGLMNLPASTVHLQIDE